MARRSSKPVDDTPEDDVVDTSAQNDETLDAETGAVDTSTSETTETQETEVAQPSWRERLGEEYSTLDDDAAISTLQRRLQEADQARNQAQQYQWQLQWQAQQQAQQAAQAQAAQQRPAEKSWNPPKYDPAWLQYVQRDENGNLVAKSGADPTLPQQLETYARWKQENEQKFWSDPYDFVMQGIGPQVQQIAQQIVQQQIASERNAYAIRDWERDKLAVLSTNGRPISADGSNMTELGKRIAQEAYRLSQTGLTDPIAALDTAYSIVSGQVAWAHANQTQQQNGAANQAAAKKQDFLKQTAKANRNGNAPRNGNGSPVVVPRMSAKDRLSQAFAAAGANPEEN